MQKVLVALVSLLVLSSFIVRPTAVTFRCLDNVHEAKKQIHSVESIRTLWNAIVDKFENRFHNDKLIVVVIRTHDEQVFPAASRAALEAHLASPALHNPKSITVSLTNRGWDENKIMDILAGFEND